MEIILKQDIKNLGEKDSIVNVKDGYGRNYLIPKGFAKEATPSNKKILAEYLRRTEYKRNKIKEEALKLAQSLKKLKLSVGAKAGESGKIFGSVNTLQISEALKKLGFSIDRHNMTLEDEIKTLGTFMVNINLHKEVRIQLPFEVVSE